MTSARRTASTRDGAIQTVRLPGGVAATMPYRSVDAANPADVHDGVLWDIASAYGALVQIEAYADGTFTSVQQDTVVALVQSVAFR